MKYYFLVVSLILPALPLQAELTTLTSPVVLSEVNGNFTDLDTRKLDKAGGAMTGTLEIGVASTTTGLINFYNSGAAYPTGIYSPGAAAPSVGIRLPGTMPTIASFAYFDTNGYWTWLDAATKQDAITDGTSTNDFLKWDGDSWEPEAIATMGPYTSGTEADIVGTLLNPQAIYDNDATNHAVTLIADAQAAFTISEIIISCDADPTTEIIVTFQHKAAGIGYGTPTTIEAVTTTAGAAAITTGIDDPTIPAGVKVFATLSDPDDALNECAFQLVGIYD